MTGNNNQVSAAGMSGASISVSGTGNTVTAGLNDSVAESGSGNTITVGANSSVNLHGTNATVYATQGGDQISLNTLSSSTNTLYATNDSISAGQGAVTVNGNRNQISEYSGGTINLRGSNNTVTLGKAVLATGEGVATTTGSLTYEGTGFEMTGNVTPSSVTLTGGVLTAQLGNGNVVTMSGVSSGTQVEYVDASGNATWTTLTDTGLVGAASKDASGLSASIQANQLVSAIASYSGSAVAGLSASATPINVDAGVLLASAYH